MRSNVDWQPAHTKGAVAIVAGVAAVLWLCAGCCFESQRKSATAWRRRDGRYAIIPVTPVAALCAAGTDAGTLALVLDAVVAPPVSAAITATLGAPFFAILFLYLALAAAIVFANLPCLFLQLCCEGLKDNCNDTGCPAGGRMSYAKRHEIRRYNIRHRRPGTTMAEINAATRRMRVGAVEGLIGGELPAEVANGLLLRLDDAFVGCCGTGYVSLVYKWAAFPVTAVSRVCCGGGGDAADKVLDSQGNTRLHAAALYLDVAEARRQLDVPPIDRPAVNAVNNDGETPLCVAVSRVRYDGADIETTAVTALELVRLLVACGADTEKPLRLLNADVAMLENKRVQGVGWRGALSKAGQALASELRTCLSSTAATELAQV